MHKGFQEILKVDHGSLVQEVWELNSIEMRLDNMEIPSDCIS